MVEFSWIEMKSILKKRMVKGALFFGITLLFLIGSLGLAYSREPEMESDPEIEELIAVSKDQLKRPIPW
jgi:hypothetical protein